MRAGVEIVPAPSATVIQKNGGVMDAIGALLESQPLFTLFLTVALGYVVGEISIKGCRWDRARSSSSADWPSEDLRPRPRRQPFSARLACCCFFMASASSTAPSSSRASTGATESAPMRPAAFGVVGSGCVSLALVPLFGVKLDESLGMFAGSGTSTATLQAIIAAMKSDGAAVGYSVAYPFVWQAPS